MSANIRMTRPSNKDTHPGTPDIDEEVLNRPIPKPRRTKVQVAADNAAAVEKKAAKAEEAKLMNEKKTQLIGRIATLEKKMLDDEQQADREAARPPTKKRTVLLVRSPINSKCMKTHYSNERNTDT
jgi:hypothetical protein